MEKYIHCGHSFFDIEKFEKPVNRRQTYSINKPYGGLWATPSSSNYTWRDWCLDNDYKVDSIGYDRFTFYLSDTARVYHIHSIEDANKLPVIKPIKYRFTDPLNIKVFNFDWGYDWEKIVEQYDAVQLHLNENLMDLYYLFSTWDLDSIVVLNPEVVVEEYINIS
jgi:hypothetical protein